MPSNRLIVRNLWPLLGLLVLLAVFHTNFSGAPSSNTTTNNHKNNNYHRLNQTKDASVLSQPSSEPHENASRPINPILLNNSSHLAGIAPGSGTITRANNSQRPTYKIPPPSIDVQPRAFEYYRGGDLPCFTPRADWPLDRSHIHEGLLFGKPMKVGGSTAAGIHLRMARNAADRQGKHFPICALSWDHGQNGRRFQGRQINSNSITNNLPTSLLWTLFRDPTKRLISMFYHFQVSRGLANATAYDFQRWIDKDRSKMQSYYVKQATMLRQSSRNRIPDHIASIIREIDFIGITERFDESIVALSILWGVPLADVLYLSAKTSGGYDGGGGGCHLIPKGEILPGMQQIIDSFAFQSMIKWDNVVYRLANESLDLTIEQTIGREKFEKVLATFQHAQDIAHERCAKEVIFPCTNGGKEYFESGSDSDLEEDVQSQRYSYEETDCIINDSGCGFMCLDAVASDLGLWGDAGELQYRYPRAFGLGKSTVDHLIARLNVSAESQERYNQLVKWETGYEKLPERSFGHTMSAETFAKRFAFGGKSVSPEQLLSRIQPRAFPKFDGDLPCYPPNPKFANDRSPASVGLLFSKPTKVGGSTAAGVHARIARNTADRQGKNYPLCDLRWDHGRTSMKFAFRDKTKSLLWTVFREPRSRYVSLFYHFQVSRGRMEASAPNFLETIKRYHKGSNYLTQGSIYNYNQRDPYDDPGKHIKSILQELDFIAITERMDESLVALAMLWGLPLADVLYLSAKQNGEYDGGGGGCHLLQKGVVLPGMQEVLDSEYFDSVTKWDSVLYQLANRSLDMTIDQTIGREDFNHALATYRHAKEVAHERCSGEVAFPCTGGGIIDTPGNLGSRIPPQDTDCLMKDSGCGYMCLDDVASELGLWGSSGELKYRYPGAFGLGNSSIARIQQRLDRTSSSAVDRDPAQWKTGFENLTVPESFKVYAKQRQKNSLRRHEKNGAQKSLHMRMMMKRMTSGNSKNR